MPFVSSALSSEHFPWHHPRHPRRLGLRKAVMAHRHNRQSEQFDLLFPKNNIDLKHQPLDQTARMEVIELLKLLLSECVNCKVVRKEISNDQDQH